MHRNVVQIETAVTALCKKYACMSHESSEPVEMKEISTMSAML